MFGADVIYGLAGTALFVIGLRGALLHRSLLRQVVGINISGSGIFLVFVALAYQGRDTAPDPLPHALVLTGIVVAVSATALALALARRLRVADDE